MLSREWMVLAASIWRLVAKIVTAGNDERTTRVDGCAVYRDRAVARARPPTRLAAHAYMPGPDESRGAPFYVQFEALGLSWSLGRDLRGGRTSLRARHIDWRKIALVERDLAVQLRETLTCDPDRLVEVFGIDPLLAADAFDRFVVPQPRRLDIERGLLLLLACLDAVASDVPLFPDPIDVAMKGH